MIFDMFANFYMVVVSLLLLGLLVGLIFVAVFLIVGAMRHLGFSLQLPTKDIPVQLVRFNTLEEEDLKGILFTSGTVYDIQDKKWIKKSHFKILATYEVEECLKEQTIIN